MPDSKQRYAPEKELPPYSYVSGRFPHPISDPQGHSFGVTSAGVPLADSDRWQESVAYRYGIDLFNFGYYWEAHETWEALWHAAGRSGSDAVFFQGLIKLAAAGVKLREGNQRGLSRHALRARELFQQISGGDIRCFGLAIKDLILCAEDLVANPPDAVATAADSVMPILRYRLAPGCSPSVSHQQNN
jgi:hypothetical protein